MFGYFLQFHCSCKKKYTNEVLSQIKQLFQNRPLKIKSFSKILFIKSTQEQAFSEQD